MLSLDSSVEVLKQNVERISAQCSEISSHVDTLLASIEEQKKAWKQEQLIDIIRTRGALSRKIWKEEQAPAFKSTLIKKDLQEYQSMLSSMAPMAYSQWMKLIEVNRKAYEGTPIHSCSVKGHLMADVFRDFIAFHLKGRVLDIGCGPQPVSWYLGDYPPHLISGIDPLMPEKEEHPFEFYQGVAEFLPWGDDEFDVVIVATSLDHVLLLDKVLREVHRVLKPGGRFLTWVYFVSGAKCYDPMSSDCAPVDQYHLFHFDKEWFEELMQHMFSVEEVFHLSVPAPSSFYSFVPCK